MQFVYVIELHTYDLVQFGCPRIFFQPIIFKLDKHVVLLLKYTVQISLQIVVLRGAALTTRRRQSIMSLCFLMCFCLCSDFSAVQVLLFEAQETLRFGYSG